MKVSAKSFILTLVGALTFSMGAAPAMAETPDQDFSQAGAVQPASDLSQSLNTTVATLDAEDTGVLDIEASGKSPHGFDVEKSIALAKSEVGTSRPTGWSAPGECIMSAQRWIRAGGGAWGSGGNPVTNYDGATRLAIADAEPGDIVQYENIASPTSWVTGVHTLMIIGVNDDGTFDIIESNNPGGSGLVSEDKTWTPKPPEGFQAVVWRF